MRPLHIKVLFALLVAIIAGLLTNSLSIGCSVFAVLLIISLIPIYVNYAQDNPHRLWFKRKMFGWGWTPVTWQGWVTILVYLVGVFGFASTIDENSSPREIGFMFVIPIAILTSLLIRICYRKGEKPRWQWGKDISKYE